MSNSIPNTVSSRLKRVPRSDLILGVVALFSAVVYLVLLPRVHPDSLASVQITGKAAAESARSLLISNGVDVEGLRSTVVWRRNEAALDLLQEQLGRSALLRRGAAFAERVAPLYYPEIRFLEGAQGDFVAHRVRLTADGDPWYMETVPGARRGQVESELIAEVLTAAGVDAQVVDTFIMQLPDSLLAPRLGFDVEQRQAAGGAVRPGDSRTGNARPGEAPSRRPPRVMRPGGRFVLGLDEAKHIASKHVSRYALPGWSSEPDSAYFVPGERLAHVLFDADEGGSGGLVTTVDVAVTPTGLLQRINVVHSDLESQTETTPRINLSTASMIVAGAIFVLLGIVLVVFFFRRLINRAIDVKAALIDALAFSLMFVAYMLTAQGVIQDGGILWVRLLAVAATILIGGTVVSLAAFIISGAADSLARRGWSKKLFTTSLVRQGALFNGFVASAVLRGLAVGLVILAVTSVSMWVFADAPLALDDVSFGGQSMRPALGAVGLAGITSYLKAVVVILTVVALLYRPKQATWPALLVAGVALTFVLTSLAGFTNAWLNWLVSGVIATIAVSTFWRFDLLALFSAFSSSSLVWYTQEGWLMAGSPYWVDLLAVGLFFALIVGGCIVGIRRGNNVPGGAEYVPSYIKELRRQERLQSELAIAHEVQESFLPHETPDVEYLDIAATCIPAEVVGGDYYDLVKISSHELAVAIGDVSGKGIQAAFFMTLAKGFLRSLSRERSSPADVLAQMNRLFMECAPRGVFISMVYGIVDVSTGQFRFARAGHNPVILKRASGETILRQPKGIGIGLDSGREFDRHIEEETVALQTNDALVFYTDGFSEARNPGHEEFGDARLEQSVATGTSKSASGLLDDVCQVVNEFVDGAERHDDMTMLVVRYTGRGEPSFAA